MEMGSLAGIWGRDHLKNVAGNMVGWPEIWWGLVLQLDLIEHRTVLEGICNKILKDDNNSEIRTRTHMYTSCRAEVSEHIVIQLFEIWLHILLQSDDDLQHCGPG